NPDSLTSLRLIRLRDELAAARRCGPADVAELVAVLILAQALEVASRAALAGAPLLERHLTAAYQEQRMPLRIAEVRIDADRLRQRKRGPPRRERPRTAISDERHAHHLIAALPRHHLVFDTRLAARRDRDLPLRQLRPQRRRDIVDDVRL